MKKLICFFAGILLLCGCTPRFMEECLYNEAKAMIINNKAECIIIHDNKIAAVERGRGVSPLLKLHDSKKELMKNSIIVDKVIGRAAAFIAISGKASFVYGKIMSEDAKELLAAHNIKTDCDLLVPKILNRKRDGLCPLEDSVKDAKDSVTALKQMRKRIAELRSAQSR